MVGERLAELREQKALTLRDLEEASGVGADAISKIENGHRKPRPSTLRKLARALGVEVEDFFREPAVPLAEAPRETGLAGADPSAKLAAVSADPSARLAEATALEKIAELWSEQLARGFYDNRTLGMMGATGFVLAANHEAAIREVRENLPLNFRAQLEAAEEQFAAVGAQLWALEEVGRADPAPPDSAVSHEARREAKREELLQQLRGSRQAKHG
jgi:transcriptional regulator with XRE-family HTH domain